ncbi:MAG TPA: M42 family peptidase [candidate division WOR-3 bacterium]|uniref:M42 family peptidase n=1 Tax=candidate division WOR-3 bacterium TaxID=2052148 RepID=A0A9C9EKC7_UNCW3|nr:M42 family peptidase [candidate division WOR-3 bacterium]
MDRIELLKQLTDAFGVSGYEDEVFDILKKHFADHITLTKDKIGSIIAKKSGTSEKPKIMFAAHMDEIGFMVKEITKEGFIKFLPIGGWWSGNLPGLRVKIKTRKDEFIPGVIGLKPIHDLSPEERKKLPDIEHMYIDVGATSNFDIKEKLGIRPGDPIVPDTKFEQMANKDLLLAKAWDDRVSCGLLVELFNNLTATEHPNTVYLVGTVQEEVGLRGAKTSAYTVAPDIGFALDVSICRDTPGNEGEAVEKLGGGVSILIYDRTMIPHSKLKDFVCELADLNNIPYHFTSIKGGYDTGQIHLTHFGVPSLAIGIPSRYVHSGSSIISLEDYENVLNLITLIVKNLDEETMKQILK